MTATLKPRLDPLLWAQLRPSVISARKAGGEDASQTLSTGIVPLVPENRIATSLRVVLHDTKSVMEQFSDKLEHLLCDVDKTRRQIDKSNDNFENAHDKVLEELVATVNRCQKGLLEVLDNPAQASDLNEVKASQMETVKKMEQFATRVDIIQNSLHSILEQQGQILTCLSSLTPMAAPLQDVPQQLHHIASQLSLMQPLYQSLPDQLKLAQHETSNQNIQAIHDAFSAAFSTSTENNLESLGRVVSESVTLITAAIAGGFNNPQNPTMSRNHDRTAESELRSKPNCSRQCINTNLNQDSSMMMLRPQGGQGGTDTNSSLGESGDSMSCPSDHRRTCGEQESERARLVNPTARNKTAKSTSATKRKSNAAFHSTASRKVKKVITKESNPKARVTATSDRVLRSQNYQPETALFSGGGDQAASLLNESILSVIPINKILDPPFTGSYDEIPPVVPAPLPKRRVLLPSDPDQQVDFELDWGQI